MSLHMILHLLTAQIPWISKEDNWQKLTLQMSRFHLLAMPYILELLLDYHIFMQIFQKHFYQR